MNLNKYIYFQKQPNKGNNIPMNFLCLGFQISDQLFEVYMHGAVVSVTVMAKFGSKVPDLHTVLCTLKERFTNE